MFDTIKELQNYRNSTIETIRNIDDHSIAKVVQILLHARNKGTMIFVFGNGGSGATASHFVGDLLKSLSYGFEKRFRAMCLNDNIPTLSAYSNDVSYDDVFLEQLKNFAQEKDVVLGLSGSGNSQNVVKALEYANQIGATTVAISGFDGGKIKQLAQINLHAKINDMDIVENVHLFVLHYIKRILMLEIQGEKG